MGGEHREVKLFARGHLEGRRFKCHHSSPRPSDWERNLPQSPPSHQPTGSQPSAAKGGPQSAAGSCAAGVRRHPRLKIPCGCRSSTLTPRAGAATSPTRGHASGVPQDAHSPVCARTGQTLSGDWAFLPTNQGFHSVGAAASTLTAKAKREALCFLQPPFSKGRAGYPAPSECAEPENHSRHLSSLSKPFPFSWTKPKTGPPAPASKGCWVRHTAGAPQPFVAPAQGKSTRISPDSGCSALPRREGWEESLCKFLLLTARRAPVSPSCSHLLCTVAYRRQREGERDVSVHSRHRSRSPQQPEKDKAAAALSSPCHGRGGQRGFASVQCGGSVPAGSDLPAACPGFQLAGQCREAG